MQICMEEIQKDLTQQFIIGGKMSEDCRYCKYMRLKKTSTEKQYGYCKKYNHVLLTVQEECEDFEPEITNKEMH